MAKDASKTRRVHAAAETTRSDQSPPADQDVYLVTGSLPPCPDWCAVTSMAHIEDPNRRHRAGLDTARAHYPQYAAEAWTTAVLEVSEGVFGDDRVIARDRGTIPPLGERRR